ncbi:hypothetical protein GCM10010449_02150 [Streptomyces rectiviolaceus]|uniref:Uncharacterized protein n=1 Tax=Streptomyces rectiviolaceus TaxID=332591 RepID=A0ABP6M5U0_9ACTN
MDFRGSAEDLKLPHVLWDADNKWSRTEPIITQDVFKPGWDFDGHVAPLPIYECAILRIAYAERWGDGAALAVSSKLGQSTVTG